MRTIPAPSAVLTALALSVASFAGIASLAACGGGDTPPASSAQSLAAYALGLPAFVLIKVMGPGFFARGDMSTPVRVGMGILALNVALSLALMQPLKHVGPPLATSLAMSANVLILTIMLLRRGYLVPDTILWSRLARMGAAALVMAGVLWQARLFLVPESGHAVSIVTLCALVAAGLMSYGATAFVLGLGALRKVARA